MNQRELIPQSFAGSLKGRRAFVLGNGPSLSEMDLSGLNGEWVIGTNRSSFGVVSDYYVLLDSRFPQEFPSALQQAYWHGSCIVVREDIADKIPPDFPCYLYKYLNGAGFNPDPHSGFYTGSSVVIPALQLAYWLGADPIIILGVDLTDYTKCGIIHWMETEVDQHRRNTQRRGKNPDATRWGREGHPGFRTIQDSFTAAVRQARAEQRSIVNAGVNSRLQGVPRIEFTSLFSSPTAVSGVELCPSC